MKPDDIISYSELVAEEKANLQKGMNFGIGKKYTVFLTSVRPDGPCRGMTDPGDGSHHLPVARCVEVGRRGPKVCRSIAIRNRQRQIRELWQCSETIER
jgi:hypothetical protein